MASMIEDKGAEYVTAWPANIARMLNLSPEYIIEAVNTVTGSTIPRHAAYNINGPIAEVGALTGEQARDAVAEARRISATLTTNSVTNCHYCGLPVASDGKCRECV
jgi:hypothetical protein